MIERMVDNFQRTRLDRRVLQVRLEHVQANFDTTADCILAFLARVSTCPLDLPLAGQVAGSLDALQQQGGGRNTSVLGDDGDGESAWLVGFISMCPFLHMPGEFCRERPVSSVDASAFYEISGR
eukprot:CAMPEP_0180795388 /NCGR_PEP_ID=MMETSP1038_2-20121128/56175_1 /TAXON_ID=632150 /ORGANISM="Azadinium spinosum, Strain 3D9" /LENGTH=123 /DNA_ID=CAMNT_0022834309 /DNA_START=139 /DNA_END=508 /DNA_ORIENTATION=-